MVKKNIKNKSKFHWTPGYIALYIFFLIIIIIIFKIIMIKRTYSPTFEWWEGNGGKNYTKFFNLFAVMSSYDSIIFYWFSKLFGNLYNQITRGQIMFLVNRIFPLMRSTNPDNINTSRFVLPSHIANDIKLSRGQDKFFDNFLETALYTNPISGDTFRYDDSVQLRYDYTNPDKPVRKVDKETGKVGVYPGPSSSYTNDWLTLFKEWGSTEWTAPYPLSPQFQLPTMNDTVVKAWLGTDTTSVRPDNFLARYGIMPDSPLVISYISQSFNDPRTGLKLDPQCFTNLIGGNSSSLPGGWVSYLNGMESSSTSADDYTNYIYSSYLTENPANNGGKTSTCDVAGNDISGAVTGIGIAAMAAFVFEPLGLAAALGFILVGGGLGAAQAVNANNRCQK